MALSGGFAGMTVKMCIVHSYSSLEENILDNHHALYFYFVLNSAAVLLFQARGKPRFSSEIKVNGKGSKGYTG